MCLSVILFSIRIFYSTTLYHMQYQEQETYVRPLLNSVIINESCYLIKQVKYVVNCRLTKVILCQDKLK